MRNRKQRDENRRTARILGGWRPSSGLKLALPLLAFVLLFAVGCGTSQKPAPVTPEEIAAEIIPEEGEPTSYGIPISLSNTQRFIDYYNAVALTPEQENVRRDALQAFKAPCCDDNTMDRC